MSAHIQSRFSSREFSKGSFCVEHQRAHRLALKTQKKKKKTKAAAAKMSGVTAAHGGATMPSGLRRKIDLCLERTRAVAAPPALSDDQAVLRDGDRRARVQAAQNKIGARECAGVV